MPVSFYDVRGENRAFLEEFRQAFERILGSGRFVLGQEIKELERELSDYLGFGPLVCVKSGTDALYFGMKALGIGPGDEVITPSFTFPGTITAILRTGAQPVLSDIDPDTLCLSFESCQSLLTAKTKAVLLVHLFGNCANIDRFINLCQKQNLILIEDAAQAIGSEYRGRKLGGFGAISTFSFYPTKNLGALGNGGAVFARDTPINCETSARLDEFQAAFLRVKLRQLDFWLARRRQLAERYRSALSPLVKIVQSAPGSLPNFHQFALLTRHRDALRSFLASKGIETMIYYPQPTTAGSQQPRAEEAERASQEILCLPIRHNLTDAEQEFIINTILDFFKRL